MIKKILFTILCFQAVYAFAQFTTPNSGVNWNLDSLVMFSGGAVISTGNGYRITQNIIIDTNDVITQNLATEITIDSAVLVEVSGTLNLTPNTGNITINATDTSYSAWYRGIRFNASSFGTFKKVIVTRGGGIRLSGGAFSADSCSFIYNANHYATGSVLALSGGRPTITNSLFENNEAPAIGSPANIATAVILKNCELINNNTDNTNRPQINMGPSGTDTSFIINNVIRGSIYDKSGGIAFANLLGGTSYAVIDSNLIEDNRYGITHTGNNITSWIRYNTIQNNNIENLPLSGGSGLNFYSTSPTIFTTVTGNIISGNLWGVTLQGSATANLGDTSAAAYNPGENNFFNNGNGGVAYDLYNNTTNTIHAMGNCWGVAVNDSVSIDSVVFHFPDDANLGRVYFMPACISTELADGITNKVDISVYPNPAVNTLNIKTYSVAIINLYDLNGRQINIEATQTIQGNYTIPLQHLPAGLYILSVKTDSMIITKKVVIEK